MSFQPDSVPLMSFQSDSVPPQESIVSCSSPEQFQDTKMEVQREMPRDHFIWSLCCFYFFNPCCLGFAALVYSVKARDRKVLGDIEAAKIYASTARTLNIISTVLLCLLFVTAIIATAVVVVLYVRHVVSFSDHSNDKYNRFQYSG